MKFNKGEEDESEDARLGRWWNSLLIVAVWLAICAIQISNKEVRLRNLGTAQTEKCQVVMDNMWKIIKQKTQVNDKYKDAFVEAMTAQTKGREGGGLLKFVTESQLNLDPSIWKDLSAAIEAQRNIFTREQETLIDICNQHRDMRTVIPYSLICGSRPAMEAKLVTSSRTKEAYATGEDNDTKL